MANTILTATQIAREFGRVLHSAGKFIATINRQYDDQFANSGANRSDSVKILLPAEFTIRTGAALAAQDFTESSVTLQQATQKGVDVNFTSKELTLDLNTFSERVLSPMAKVLAANIEADALSMYKDVPNLVDGDAAAISPLHILKGGRALNEHLVPEDGRRSLQLVPSHMVGLVDNMKGLFNAQGKLSEQFREGQIASDTLGFDQWYQNVKLPPSHATGTAAKTTGYLSNGATQSGASIAVDTGTTTFKKGDVITFAGVNDVDRETKADLGYLKQFVITADYAGGAGNLAISPALVATGGGQNASSTIADNSAVVKVGAGASETLVQSLGYGIDAFAIAFADLLDVSQFGAWGARRMVDKMSIRVARQYDINNDKFPTRIDVFYGYKTVRPELAVRIHADG